MSNLSLPYNIIQDQQNQIKASSVHVQGNFDALTSAVNNRLDLDGSNTPTADISMGSHKLTNVATPTVSGDAATKGYVDSGLNAYSARNLTFTGTVNATTQPTSDNSTKVATTKFVIDILKAMYPVGSLYIAKSSVNTCPLQTLGVGTWTLRSDSAVVTNVNSSASVAVYGNGKGLVLTNSYGSWGIANDADQSGNAWSASSQNVGGNIGSSANRAYPTNGNTIFGVSTDSTKSGLVGTATISSDSISAHIWERTA